MKGIFRWTMWGLRWLTILAMPFAVLIRGSVYAYSQLHYHHWAAMGVGALASAFILMIYLQVVTQRLSKRKSSFRSLKWKMGISGALVLVYLFFVLLDFPVKNAKTSAEIEEFYQLHPLMRVALGTVIFVDSDVVVTDLSRTHSDYQKMGMKSLRNSLHYPQKDGYVHAIDLRTKGKSEWRNFLLRSYFHLMGFNTLRHGGTADHLHISLSLPSAPHVI